MTDAAAPEIVPATEARWSDVREVLDGSGEQGCWCQAWRGLDTKAISGGKPRTQLLREQMRGGPPAPGFPRLSRRSAGRAVYARGRRALYKHQDVYPSATASM